MRTDGDASDGSKLLIFDVSGCTCALPVEVVRDIAHRPALTRLPSQPPIVEGFLTYRGRPLAVLPLARLLGLPDHRPSLYAPLLIVGQGSDAIGLLADSVEGVVGVPDSDLQPVAANHSLNDCAVSHFTFEEKTVALLAGDRILLREERSRIQQLTDQAARRLEGLSVGDSSLPEAQ